MSLANPIAFLAASVAGYLGHALLTFREETGGQQFARRWLLLQYVVNISLRPAATAQGPDPGAGVHPHGAQCLDLVKGCTLSLRRRGETVTPCATPMTWV